MNLKRLLPEPIARLFLFGAGASVSVTIAASLVGLAGVSGLLAMVCASAVVAALVLAWSQFLLRKEGLSLGTLGFPTDKRRMMDLAAGFSISATLFLLLAYWQSSLVSASWHFQGLRGLVAAGIGLGLTASMVLAEEILFRGVGLRYLRAMVGDWPAIACTAVAFGAYHIVGSQNWGAGLALEFLAPTLGGIVFGWAAVRSGGIALPLGLHWGGNWIQAAVAGFAPEGSPMVTGTAHAMWRIPVSAADVSFLMSPDPAPRFPAFIAIALVALATALFFNATATALLNADEKAAE